MEKTTRVGKITPNRPTDWFASFGRQPRSGCSVWGDEAFGGERLGVLNGFLGLET